MTERRTNNLMLRQTRHIHRAINVLQSILLIAGMASIAGVCAWTIWGSDGVIWAFAGVALALLLSPSIPPELILSLYRARPLSPKEFPEGYAIIRQLSKRAELPNVPKLYYVASSTLNAFAVGSRSAAAIAVTDGLLRTLSVRELAGVLAHEVGHIRNNDLWIMNLADTMARVTGWLSYFGMFLLILNMPLMMSGSAVVPWVLVLMLVFAPTFMSLLQLALSRAREFDADLSAAELSGDPLGLASALEKLERYQGRFWEEIWFPGRRIPEPSLLRTHPPTEERVRRLLELKGLTHREATQRPADSIEIPVSLELVKAPPRWRWPGLWY